MHLLYLLLLTSASCIYSQFFDDYYLMNQKFMNNDDSWSKFQQFQTRFHRRYESFTEMRKRFEIFRSNLYSIELHNSIMVNNFTLSVNQFTDLTNDEFVSMNRRGLQYKNLGLYQCEAYVPYTNPMSLPENVDWREKNAVTSVKDQGQCGSCWTFSATGAIEGAWSISNGELMDLSEQELVDCAVGFQYGSHGCNGGQMDGAFKFVIQNGQCSLADYPYVSGNTGKSGDCMPCVSVAQMAGCYDVEPNNQIDLKNAVFEQPVSIAIEADTFVFQSYSSGILDSVQCGTGLDHGVLIVGYGNDNGQLYWTVKNSWGESWGENGYIRIARSESSDDPGICGIAMQPSFPVVH